MGNVDAVRLRRLSPFRKTAIATWASPRDPTIYGLMRLRMDRALVFLEQQRAMTGQHLTVTHLVVKALATALAACPDANVILRGSSVYRRRRVDIAVQVLTETAGQQDLSVALLRAADTLPLAAIASSLAQQAAAVRGGEPQPLDGARRLLGRIPTGLVRALLRLMTLVTYTLNLRLPGVPRDPFGSALVTSIGSLGLPTAFVPLVPYTRVPILIAPGGITEEAVVDDGNIVVGKVMYLTATLDHRLIDGAQASRLTRTVQSILEDPSQHLCSR